MVNEEVIGVRQLALGIKIRHLTVGKGNVPNENVSHCSCKEGIGCPITLSNIDLGSRYIVWKAQR